MDLEKYLRETKEDFHISIIDCEVIINASKC